MLEDNLFEFNFDMFSIKITMEYLHETENFECDILSWNYCSPLSYTGQNRRLIYIPKK